MIDPRRLRVLRALADSGTVTAAAQALFLTPSAVSQQLAALESEVGQPILHHTGRRVELTAAGRILLSHANTVLAELERAEAALAAHAGGLGGEVTVAAFATAISLLVAPAIAELRTTAPGVRIEVRDVEGQESLPMLLRSEIDVAVADESGAVTSGSDERLAARPLYREPFDAALPIGHRLADADRIRLTDLADSDERWIAPAPGNPCHDMIAAACTHAGVAPMIAHHSYDFRATAALVRVGAGISLIPRHALGETDLSGVVLRPLSGIAPERRVSAVVRRGGDSRPAVAAVLDAVEKQASLR